MAVEDLGVSLGVSRGLRTGLSLDRGSDASSREASEAQENWKLHAEMDVERQETETCG